jgi:diguanylate cyclase (GGDEF)-like protein/PAS domain S-box-containing protein
MVWVLWGHVVGLSVFLFAQGFGVRGSIGPILPLVAAAVAADLKGAGRRARSVAVVFGLLTASAVLVYAWHGQIEAHFDFFVMIALLALYEDWLPFGIAVLYVLLEHGVLGALAPHSVYSHGGNPWVWATVHTVFVLGAGAAGIATWRLNEDTRGRMREAHDAARMTAERFRVAFESGISGMAMETPDGRFLRVNRALCEMIGYTEQELLSRSFADITHPEDLHGDLEQIQALRAGAIDVYETEKRYVHRHGHVVWVQLGVKTVRDADGQLQYFITQTNDITTRKHYEDELAHRALHDPLTGLPNRSLFLDRLSHALLRLHRHPGHLAVFFVDLDRFKLANDTMGHDVGDDILREAVSRISGAVRAEDTVARFGGDEFTILCENADEAEGCRIAQRLLDAFARPFEHHGREFHLSASVGIRINNHASTPASALLRDADVALYAAKRHGRGRFEIFDAEAKRPGFDLFATEQELRLAIGREELCLHYQPEVDLSTGRILGVEALVRWRHRDRGIIPPAQFIPIAEESGLIVVVGEWVLRQACTQLAAWRAARTVADDFRVAVNISTRQLSDPDLAQLVSTVLTETALPATALCLEITESALVDDPEVGLANLSALKRLGVEVGLDDFGVGFSSLSRIRDLPPIDLIKIDRSFTAGIERNGSDGAVITAILSLASNLGIPVVAEGIECEAQFERLRTLGCDIGQGFFFSRPQPAEHLAVLLADGIALPASTHPTGTESTTSRV